MPVDMQLSYGGGVQIGANGDLLLVEDTATDPAATRQRIVFALLTSPRLFDAQGNPISTPDWNIFPDYGAGLPSIIGKALTPALVSEVTSLVNAALADDPYVSTSPPATVVLTQTARNTISVSVAATAITGQPVVVPAIDLSALVTTG